MANVIGKINVGGVEYDLVIPAGLTEEQQAQIRANIGAVAEGSTVVENGTYPEMTVGKAIGDGDGNNISDTYVKAENFDRLMLENEYPVGGRPYIQFSGMKTPAQRWANTTWEIDTDYTGRTIVGSGAGYELGATGGQETQQHSLVGSAKIGLGNDYIGFRPNNRGETFQTSKVVGVSAVVDSFRDGVAGVDITGSTSLESIMQPYKVVAVWKRVS